jgi:hypothetical protein
MVKNNTGRKLSVIRDELNISNGGIYCFMPFERLDKYKKAIFKIGMSMDFSSRAEQYHTYFPLGVYMIAFLESPSQRVTRNTNQFTKKEYYLKVERWIMDYIEKNGGQRIYSTTRVHNANVAKEGQTEWFYTSVELIHEAFVEAEKKFNGIVHLFYLEGIDPQTNRFSSINDTATQNERYNPHYTGKIIYKT